MLGYQDEVWWSRLARPELRAWAGAEPLRLHEPPADAEDRGPKALACYGLLRGDTGGMMLRFVEGLRFAPCVRVKCVRFEGNDEYPA